MKIILSRKGFDTEYGGGPSPILDGKRIVSLPIEYGGKEKIRKFNDIRFDGKNLGQLVEQLYPDRNRNDYCHLDPDLRQDAIPRRILNKQWRPLFGQADAAAGHLIKTHRISEGDLFLFFGLFQPSDGWKSFLEGTPMHLIHGWLQVDQVITDPVSWALEKENHWAREHPHTYGNWWKSRNVCFLAKRYLEMETSKGKRKTGLPGAGIFKRYDHQLRLSDPNSHLKSHWRLPKCLKPDKSNGQSMSYIGNQKYWKMGSDLRYVYLDPGSTTLWQEAVISGNPDAAKWAVNLIKSLT